MHYITRYHNRMKYLRYKTAALTFVLALFFVPGFTMPRVGGESVFEVMVNGQTVGRLRDGERAQELLLTARKNIAAASAEQFLADADLYVEGRVDNFAHFSTDEEMIAAMEEVLKAGAIRTDKPAWSVKVGRMMVSLRDLDQVRQALQRAADTYQDGEQFLVTLKGDDDRQVSVLTAQILAAKETEKESVLTTVGSGDDIGTEGLSDLPSGTGFAGFDYGLKELYFATKVEVAESYLSDDQLLGVDEAADKLTKLWQEEKIYKVKSGDTLSEIAIETDTPLDELIALNSSLEDENSTIREGQELITTSAVPTLSIGRVEELYYEEDYEAEIEYIYNDDWYTTDKETRQQPSAGHRKVAAKKTYLNDEEVSTEILKEEVTYPAVPKIVEIGTKVPPTYIKPISGGRISSPFGRRKAPKKGASTYHKGIDWATPVGTAVVASSGGVVERAGWGSGYGYVVYINHADGRQTRYGHLSKILVKPGERVSQGQKIALSGNTGRSTGPHIHFEMLIGGAAVNPLNYLN